MSVNHVSSFVSVREGLSACIPVNIALIASDEEQFSIIYLVLLLEKGSLELPVVCFVHNLEAIGSPCAAFLFALVLEGAAVSKCNSFLIVMSKSGTLLPAVPCSTFPIFFL